MPGRCIAAVIGGLVVLAIAVEPVSAQQAVGQPAATPQAGADDRPPLPNRVNQLLPSWLRVRGEFRERAERVDAAGFTDGRDDAFFLSRVRLNATVTSTRLAATVQVQDSRVAGKTVGPTGAPFSATFDLRQAYADIGGARLVTLRLGRQELTLGDQRLVGPSNWTNVARTFDGARMTIASRAVQVDVFAASVVRILAGELDKSGNGNRLAGVQVAAGRLLPAATMETYAFYRRDRRLRPESGPLATLSQWTLGARLVGRAPAALDYNVEVATQAGSLGTDDVSAWAGHWVLRHSLAGAQAMHLTSEFNYASGDENPGDGERGTFDQLYQSGHDKHGLADQVGWRNIRHVRLGFDLTPVRATPLSVNWHSYWLVEKADGLYSGSGALLARVPGGASSARVGQELDVQITHPLTPQLALAAGYAHLFPGAFLKQATPGHSYRSVFGMVTYVFLADK
ncbi:MAG: alginate export family protein [Vicinamibacterales bacterium]